MPQFDHTVFPGANLKGVDMEGSQMTGINLRVATLKNAKLKNCNLRGATLAGTDLEVRVEGLVLRITEPSAGEGLKPQPGYRLWNRDLVGCLYAFYSLCSPAPQLILLFLSPRTVTYRAVISKRQTCGAPMSKVQSSRRC